MTLSARSQARELPNEDTLAAATTESEMKQLVHYWHTKGAFNRGRGEAKAKVDPYPLSARSISQSALLDQAPLPPLPSGVKLTSDSSYALAHYFARSQVRQ